MNLQTDVTQTTRLLLPAKRRILIVDDDPVASLVTQRGLQARLGMAADVQVAPSSGAAWLRCLRGHVDLLIADPNPRNRSTVTLLKALRAERPELAVLVLTAYDTPRLRAEARELAVRHYFAKPIELVHLEHGVREALGLAMPAEERSAGRC